MMIMSNSMYICRDCGQDCVSVIRCPVCEGENIVKVYNKDFYENCELVDEEKLYYVDGKEDDNCVDGKALA